MDVLVNLVAAAEFSGADGIGLQRKEALLVERSWW
jgi:hypothetical protein